ncbi:MAG: aspartate aminotransferase family protein [Sciscionella sp.]|nr:aspartate aminotransferase family protein [Sciscionella sp.]
MNDLRALLATAANRAADYRQNVHRRPVFPSGLDLDAMRTALGELPTRSTDPAMVLDELADEVEHALVGCTGPRYFGFVTGGVLDAATAAEILATGWDQNAFDATSSPAAAVVELVAGEWLTRLLGLPESASVGFTTGGQGANTVCLAAARHAVLDRVGWDVERDGLLGAPRIRVLAGEQRHATVDRALRLLGLGTAALEPVPTDEHGAIDVGALERALAAGDAGPTIVCLQAGNVNSGAFDDFGAAISVAHQHNAWVHVDGAFGLWAAASPSLRHLVDGVERADSWATDGHKWLNVPYDCGYAFCAHPDAHRGATAHRAAYYSPGELRSPADYVLEASRRARGFATYAALRQLGSSGVAELIDRCCLLAKRFAEELSTVDGVDVVNEVVLNQVAVSFGDDTRTDRVIDAVQRSGVCWMGGTTWRGRRLMRISVSNWTTTAEDVDASVAAIRDAIAEVSV